MNRDRQVQPVFGRASSGAVAAVRSIIEFFPPNDATLVLDMLRPDVSTSVGIFVVATRITANLANLSTVAINPPGIVIIGETGTSAAATPTGGLVFSGLEFQMPHSIIIPSMYGQPRLSISGSAVATALNVDFQGRLFPQDYTMDEIMALM